MGLFVTITMIGGVSEPEATVVDAQCTVPGLNPFGKVTHGFVTITGRLIETTLKCPRPLDFWLYTLLHDGPKKLHADTMLEAYEGRSGLTVRRARAEAKPMPFSAPVTCLQIARKPHSILSLVVVPSESESGAYERIGFWCLENGASPYIDAPTRTITIV